jgi:hypothetical protein
MVGGSEGVEGELDEEASDEDAGLEAGNDGAVTVMLGVTGDDADTMEPGVASVGKAVGADVGQQVPDAERGRPQGC